MGSGTLDYPCGNVQGADRSFVTNNKSNDESSDAIGFRASAEGFWSQKGIAMRKMICLIGALLLAMSLNASAGYVLWDGEITGVTNTSGNTDDFVVLVTGGSGLCSTAGQITFPRDAAGTQKLHDKAYATALMALATGLKVRVATYEPDSCIRAVHIWLQK